MDTTAQLALMTKAKQVFESGGTFLSFPALAPMAYPAALLDFSKALSDPKIGAALLEFSRAVNQCPGGALFPGDSDQYLWSHYNDWLNAMTLAADDLSPEQAAAYAQAQALLTTVDANGLRADSPALTTYKQFRDRYFAAVQAYKGAQISAAAAKDAAAQATWNDVDGPHLRQSLEDAEMQWEQQASRRAIEKAQAAVSQCEAHMPQKVWEDWRRGFNPDLDIVTDPSSNASYAPSGFSPADLCTQAWTTFTLTQAEIETLAKQASQELHAIFGETGVTEIASLSFEFRSAAVVRPWFNSAVFDAAFWKFNDGAADLSDGATPPRGAWPAYVTAVVFARNIQVAMRATPQAVQQPVRVLPPPSLPPARLQVLQTERLATFVRPPPPAVARPFFFLRPAMAAAVVKPFVAPPAVRQAAPLVLPHPVPAAPPHPVIAPIYVPHPAPAAIPHPIGPTPSVFVATPPKPAIAPPYAPIHPVMRLNVATYVAAPVQNRAPAATPAPSVAPTTAQPQPQSTAVPPNDSVSILAFICRPLPKIPNPAATLNW